jgi:hypothetical protein
MFYKWTLSVSPNNQNPVLISLPCTCATCCAYLFLHDMTTVITFARNKIHDDRDCLICSNLLLLFPHHCTNIFFSTLFLDTLGPCYS